MKKRLICLIKGHKYKQFDPYNWLADQLFTFYKCERCGKIKDKPKQ